MKRFVRKLTPVELADLPESWENPKVDVTKYIQCGTRACECDEKTYEELKRGGFLCQKYQDKCYIGV